MFLVTMTHGIVEKEVKKKYIYKNIFLKNKILTKLLYI